MKRIVQWAGYGAIPIIIVLLAVLLKWESISYYTLRKATLFFADRSNIFLEIGGISGSPLSETTLKNLLIRPKKGQPQAYHLKSQSLTCT